MESSSQYLSHYVASRLDQSIEDGLVKTSRRRNVRVEITLKIHIEGGMLTHKISQTEADSRDIPCGRIVNSKIMLPEFDPEFDGALFRINEDGQEIQRPNDADYAIPPELALAGRQ
jgi:hypothetical protein